MNNTKFYPAFSEDGRVILVTVLGILSILWILIGNIITLIAVCDIKMEHQKKQVVSLLIANIYNGIINLPISLLLWHQSEIFDNSLVCLFALGLTDFGEVSLTIFTGVLTTNMFLTFRFPFKSDTFSRWETRVVVMQWIVPACYAVTVSATVSGHVTETGCEMEELPIWTHYVHTVLIVIATAVPFALSVAILRLAWKQVAAVTALEKSLQAAPSARFVSMKVKHRRLARLTVWAFLLIWTPLTVIEIVAYVSFVSDPDVLEILYFFVVCLKAAFPLFYSYTFSGVKPQVVLMLKKLHIWKNRDEKNAVNVVDVTVTKRTTILD